MPLIEPGYLQDILSPHVPEEPQNWKKVMEDFLKKVLPGITHWQSNNFHAYFLSQASYPSEWIETIDTYTHDVISFSFQFFFE